MSRGNRDALRTLTMRATWAGALRSSAVIKLISVRVDYTIASPLP